VVELLVEQLLLLLLLLLEFKLHVLNGTLHHGGDVHVGEDPVDELDVGTLGGLEEAPISVCLRYYFLMLQQSMFVYRLSIERRLPILHTTSILSLWSKVV